VTNVFNVFNAVLIGGPEARHAVAAASDADFGPPAATPAVAAAPTAGGSATSAHRRGGTASPAPLKGQSADAEFHWLLMRSLGPTTDGGPVGVAGSTVLVSGVGRASTPFGDGLLALLRQSDSAALLDELDRAGSRLLRDPSAADDVEVWSLPPDEARPGAAVWDGYDAAPLAPEAVDAALAGDSDLGWLEAAAPAFADAEEEGY
jgi:hypothetical protein